jgi:hypothetical protein
MTQTLIAGESIDDIARALMRFQFGPEQDGMARMEVTLERELGVPFHRAMLRIEAELLMQEADEHTVDGPFGEHRTDAQRRADALMELIARFSEAMGVPSDGLRTH